MVVKYEDDVTRLPEDENVLHLVDSVCVVYSVIVAELLDAVVGRAEEGVAEMIGGDENLPMAADAGKLMEAASGELVEMSAGELRAAEADGLVVTEAGKICEVDAALLMATDNGELIGAITAELKGIGAGDLIEADAGELKEAAASNLAGADADKAVDCPTGTTELRVTTWLEILVLPSHCEQCTVSTTVDRIVSVEFEKGAGVVIDDLLIAVEVMGAGVLELMDELVTAMLCELAARLA